MQRPGRTASRRSCRRPARDDARPDVLERDRAARGQEAEVAHFHKARWQDVLQEAAQKFHHGQGHRAWPGAVGMAVTEGHGVIIDADDAAIGDGDFEHEPGLGGLDCFVACGSSQ